MYDEENEVFLPQPEIWKAIKGFEGSYEVSNYGRVRSLDRTITFVRNGALSSRVIKACIRKPKVDKDGYYEYCLTVNSEKTYIRGHRLVAQAFVPNPNKLPLVDHKNNIHNCNVAWNLQWLTNAQNIIKYYAVDDDSKQKPLSALTKDEWLVVGELYNSGMLYEDIFKTLEIDAEKPETIWAVLCGKRLSSVTGFKRGDFKKRNHPVQKLSDAQVLNILKERLIDKKSLKELSKKYNIAESMISRFTKGTRRPEMLIKFKEDIQEGK